MTAALWFGLEARGAILTPQWPTLQEWLLLAALGVIATAGHMLIVQAIRRVGAGMVAPFQYLEIISATILGLVFFGAFVPFTLLARVLHLTFDLLEDSIIVYPSGIIVACAVIFAEPRTFKQLGRVATIAGGVGILAMLCFLPVRLDERCRLHLNRLRQKMPRAGTQNLRQRIRLN